ncbi:glycosyltransferase [Falsiroseomonas sp. CW058]|uniref:glycosyltransferase n=1 Tax=Falsiroseomonas sp. CW058 TaxID=3388664 RepID=UPI003D31CE43
MTAAPASPAVAIVVPIFKHAALLPEAVEAALAQDLAEGVAVVLVDDGCPFEETRATASAYALSDPRVTYLRKANGGLSSARNFGIDFALRAWPGLEAVYFLDADNRLTPTAMRNALDLMRSSGADWIYPSIDKFGIEWSGNYAAPYSRLAHVAFDNISEAGSLVARRVLDAGIRFDEAMKAGYEDWEFWLQALSHGFRGRCHPQFGLEYRQRAESMLRESSRVRAGILTYLREKHRGLWRVGNLLRWEHEEAPRFALFRTPDGEVELFSDPDLPPRLVPLADHAEAFAAEEAEPESFGTPPQLVWLPDAAVGALRSAGLWAGLLWQLERLSAGHDAVAIHLAPAVDEVALEVGEGAGTAVSGWAARQALLRESLREEGGWLDSLLGEAPQPRLLHLTLRFPEAPAPADVPDPVATRARLRRGPAPRRWNWRDGAALPQRRDHAGHLSQAVGADHVLPRARHPGGRLQIGFALPAGEGGRLRVACGVAGALRAAGAATHLHILGAPRLRPDPAVAAAFDSVTFLGPAAAAEAPHDFLGQRIALAGDLGGVDRTLVGMLGGLDLLVASGTPVLFPVLAELRKLGLRTVGHVHGAGRSRTGRGTGDPYQALAFEHALDLLLAASGEVADWLHGEGVPAAKLRVLPAAPSLAGDAAVRGPRGPGPLRALLVLEDAGDRAARDRAAQAVMAACMAGLPVAWRALGDLPPALAALGVARADPGARAAAFAQADLLVLPAGGEATGIDLRDAQRAGCVPVLPHADPAAALVADGVDGVLVEDGARAVVEALRGLGQDAPRLARLSEGAMAAAAGLDWNAAAQPFIAEVAAWFAGVVAPDGA